MSLKYCTICGTKHEYTIEIPRFCSSCGTSFGGTSVASTKPAQKNTFAKTATSKQDDAGEEDADREVPNISQIQIEIEVEKNPKIKFGEAKNSMSFARDRQSKQLTIKDLEDRLETSFERDRKDQKES